MPTSLAVAIAEVAENPNITFSRIKEIASQLDAGIGADKIPVFYSGLLPSETTSPDGG